FCCLLSSVNFIAYFPDRKITSCTTTSRLVSDIIFSYSNCYTAIYWLLVRTLFTQENISFFMSGVYISLCPLSILFFTAHVIRLTAGTRYYLWHINHSQKHNFCTFNSPFTSY